MRIGNCAQWIIVASLSIIVIISIAICVATSTSKNNNKEGFDEQLNPPGKVVVCMGSHRGECAKDLRVSGTMYAPQIKSHPHSYGQQHPGSWGGGEQSWDIYANRMIGSGRNGNISTHMNYAGDIRASRRIQASRGGQQAVLDGNGNVFASNTTFTGGKKGWNQATHRFYSGGQANHSRSLLVGQDQKSRMRNWTDHGIHVQNRGNKGWTHIGWQGKENYLRGDKTQVDGRLVANGPSDLNGQTTVRNGGLHVVRGNTTLGGTTNVSRGNLCVNGSCVNKNDVSNARYLARNLNPRNGDYSVVGNLSVSKTAVAPDRVISNNNVSADTVISPDISASDTLKVDKGLISSNMNSTSFMNASATLAVSAESENGVQVERAGPLIQKSYGKDPGSKYGIGQFSRGRTRVYAGSNHRPSTVGLSIARPNGSMDDVLTSDIHGTVSVPGTVIAGNRVYASRNPDRNPRPRFLGKRPFMGVHTWDMYVEGSLGVGSGGNVPTRLSGGDLKTDSVLVGDKWRLSGVGDGHNNDDWLRLMNTSGKDFHGGLAAGKMWSRYVDSAGDIHAHRRVCVGGVCMDEGILRKLIRGPPDYTFTNFRDSWSYYKRTNAKVDGDDTQRHNFHLGVNTNTEGSSNFRPPDAGRHSMLPGGDADKFDGGGDFFVLQATSPEFRVRNAVDLVFGGTVDDGVIILLKDGGGRGWYKVGKGHVRGRVQDWAGYPNTNGRISGRCSLRPGVVYKLQFRFIQHDGGHKLWWDNHSSFDINNILKVT